jgi:ABC-2 type transport system ATP-binding protein
VAILKVSDLHKSYGATKALNGISFEVPEGAVFGILGPNGGGKTTLLGIILDVLKADSGNFSWFDEQPSPEHRKRIGTLLETPNFYHYLSATRNLEVSRRISERGTVQDIDQVLKKVNLYDRRNGRFSTYSLGMKQRLAIGAALLGSPSVLVLDEPTNGLDPVGIVEIRELILELKAKGHTIIMASHLLDEVEKTCTHVAIMNKGNLLSCGRVDEVLTEDDQVEVGARNVDSLVTNIGDFPGLIHFKQEKDRVLLVLPKDSADLETINRFCSNKGVTLNHLYLRKQKLESRFFELTQN